MIKGFRQIASLTAISRVFGMLRDMSFAYFLGAGGLMDGWVIAFKIPNLARRLFGEGAAGSSLIPIYSEQLQKDPAKAKALANTTVTVIFMLLTLVVLAGEAFIWIYYKFFAPLESTKQMFALAGIMLPYMLLICEVAIIAGLLNAHRHFAAPAAAPILLNVFLIGSLCISGWVFSIEPQRQTFIVAAAVIIAGLAQLAIQFPALRANGISIRPQWAVNSEAFRKTILLMGPMILGLTVTQFNTLIDDIIAKWLSGSIDKGQFFTLFARQINYPLKAGAVSHLFYAQRLYQFPLGVLGIALATAIFPVMSSLAAKKDLPALNKTISQGLRWTIFIALPATAGLLLVRNQIVAVLFERGKFTETDTTSTAIVLSFYAFGLCGYFLQQILTRAFYSMQDSKIPAKSALAAVVINIALNLSLVWSMGTAGLALSTAICSYIQVIILLVALQKSLGGALLDQLAVTILKTAAATAIMSAAGGGLLYLFRNLPDTTRFDILRLAVVVPAAAGTYLLAARLLHIKEIALLGSARYEKP